MNNLNSHFLYQTSKDYDTSQSNVENIAKNSDNLADFYNKLEQHVTDRKALFKQT